MSFHRDDFGKFKIELQTYENAKNVVSISIQGMAPNQTNIKRGRRIADLIAKDFEGINIKPRVEANEPDKFSYMIYGRSNARFIKTSISEKLFESACKTIDNLRKNFQMNENDLDVCLDELLHEPVSGASHAAIEKKLTRVIRTAVGSYLTAHHPPKKEDVTPALLKADSAIKDEITTVLIRMNATRPEKMTPDAIAAVLKKYRIVDAKLATKLYSVMTSTVNLWSKQVASRTSKLDKIKNTAHYVLTEFNFSDIKIDTEATSMAVANLVKIQPKYTEADIGDVLRTCLPVSAESESLVKYLSGELYDELHEKTLTAPTR